MLSVLSAGASVPLVAVVVWAAVVFILDATTRRIPNLLSLPAIPIVGAAAVLSGHAGAIGGGVIWWAVSWVLPMVWGRAVAGGGDTKLAASLGILAAWAHPMGVFVAMGASGVLQAVTLSLVPAPVSGVLEHSAEDRTGHRLTAPLAPAMVLGAAMGAMATMGGG